MGSPQICHRCKFENRPESKRCGNKSCQAWFQTPKRTKEWVDRISETNKEIFSTFYQTEKGRECARKTSTTLSTLEARERSRQSMLKIQHLGRTPESYAKRACINVSKVELSLEPYLELLGYRHTGNGGFFIGQKNSRVRVPDYVNVKEKKVLEVFGTYWHRDMLLPEGQSHETEDETTQWYREHGWECTVVWEDQVEDFIGGLV